MTIYFSKISQGQTVSYTKVIVSSLKGDSSTFLSLPLLYPYLNIWRKFLVKNEYCKKIACIKLLSSQSQLGPKSQSPTSAVWRITTSTCNNPLQYPTNRTMSSTFVFGNTVQRLRKKNTKTSRHWEASYIFPFPQYLKCRKQFYRCCKFCNKEELQVTLERWSSI